MIWVAIVLIASIVLIILATKNLNDSKTDNNGYWMEIDQPGGK